MKHLFIPYELAVIAKEKGFNDYCLNAYNDRGKMPYSDKHCKNSSLLNGFVAAPLYQQIVDWFMTEHKLQVLWSSDKDKMNDRIKEHFTLI